VRVRGPLSPGFPPARGQAAAGAPSGLGGPAGVRAARHPGGPALPPTAPFTGGVCVWSRRPRCLGFASALLGVVLLLGLLASLPPTACRSPRRSAPSPGRSARRGPPSRRACGGGR